MRFAKGASEGSGPGPASAPAPAPTPEGPSAGGSVAVGADGATADGGATFRDLTADLAPALLALDALDADATTLRDCADFAAWCDERREAWVEAVEAEVAQ